MRHARAEALDQLEDVLVALRRAPELTEKTRGVFYCGARAFLHFHEDPAGLFADLREGEGFARMRVSTKAERATLLKRVRAALGG